MDIHPPLFRSSRESSFGCATADSNTALRFSVSITANIEDRNAIAAWRTENLAPYRKDFFSKAKGSGEARPAQLHSSTAALKISTMIIFACKLLITMEGCICGELRRDIRVDFLNNRQWRISTAVFLGRPVQRH
jgi:hypothetical protein